MTAFTTEQLLAVVERNFPRSLVQGLKDGHGWERVQAAAEALAKAGSVGLDSLDQALTMNARGAEYATGTASIDRTVPGAGKVVFPRGTTLWGIRHGGRNISPYFTTEDCSLELDSLGPVTVPVRAGRFGASQELPAKRLVRFATGTVKHGTGGIMAVNGISVPAAYAEPSDQWRFIRFLSAPYEGTVAQIVRVGNTLGTMRFLELNKAFLQVLPSVEFEILDAGALGFRVTNPEPITGGNFPWIALHGSDRNMSQLPGESLESYRKRLRALPDSVTLPALERCCERWANRTRPDKIPRIVEAGIAPETSMYCDAGNDVLTGLAPTLSALADDPRKVPSSLVNLRQSRKYFQVLLDLFIIDFTGGFCDVGLPHSCICDATPEDGAPVCVCDGNDQAFNDAVKNLHEELASIKEGGVRFDILPANPEAILVLNRPE